MLKRRLKEPFGTAGLTVAILALVVAMAGGAFAAGGGLSGKQKKEVEKIAKKVGGKPGPSGSNGAPGAKGDAGAAGANGTNGTNGANGTGVTSKPIPTSSASCNHLGGTELTSVSGTEKLCNGAEGEAGAIHPGETLPPEASETGTWGFSAGEDPKNGFAVWPVASYAIPLSAPLAAGHSHIINEAGKELIFNESLEPPVEEVTPTKCLGTFSVPSAEPGNLCIYAERMSFVITYSGIVSSTVAGALEGFRSFPGAEANGTWAVTAPE